MKPQFYENSKVPVVLSYLSPVSWINWIQGKPTFEIWGITILWFIFCRGELSKGTKRHEVIHVIQGEELYYIGFYVLYVFDWLKGLIKYRDADKAYRRIRAEQEAYSNDHDPDYPETRAPREWIKKYKV